MGHSPTRIPTFPHKPSANLDIVDISEWCYQPKKSSRSASSTQNKAKDVYEGRIIFRTWDFVGITQVLSFGDCLVRCKDYVYTL